MLDVVMPFDGKRIEVVRDEQGNPWIGVKSVCLAVGIDSKRQVSKLSSDLKFSWRHMSSTASDGKNYLKNLLGQGLKLVKDEQ